MHLIPLTIYDHYTERESDGEVTVGPAEFAKFEELSEQGFRLAIHTYRSGAVNVAIEKGPRTIDSVRTTRDEADEAISTVLLRWKAERREVA